MSILSVKTNLKLFDENSETNILKKGRNFQSLSATTKSFKKNRTNIGKIIMKYNIVYIHRQEIITFKKKNIKIDNFDNYDKTYIGNINLNNIEESDYDVSYIGIVTNPKDILQ